MIEEIEELKKKLGGKISKPKLSYKYYPIKFLFGWRIAKFFSFQGPMIKLFILTQFDKMLNYFDRSLDELTIAEAAYLAALPKAPNNYHPVRKPEAAVARMAQIYQGL